MEFGITAVVVFFVCVIIGIIVDKALERRCQHKWEIISKGTLNHIDGPSWGKPYGDWYISKCKNCGKIKKQKFI